MTRHVLFRQTFDDQDIPEAILPTSNGERGWDHVRLRNTLNPSSSDRARQYKVKLSRCPARRLILCMIKTPGECLDSASALVSVLTRISPRLISIKLDRSGEGRDGS